MTDEIKAALTELQGSVERSNQSVHDRVDDLELQLGRTGLAGDRRSTVDQEALRAYIGRGEIQNSINNSMSVGSDPDGGLTVQPQLADSIFSVMREVNPLRDFARIITLRQSDAFEEIQDRAASAGATWVGETDSRPATSTPQLGKLRIPAREIYAQPEITQMLLDDSTVDLAAWLSEKLGREFAVAEGTAFVTGAGVDRPRGFADYPTEATADGSRDWGKFEHVTSGAAGAFPTLSGSTSDDPAALFDAIAALKPQYRQRARWYMNRSTWSTVRKLRDSQGRFLLTPGINGDPDNLLGFPAVAIEDLPDIGSNSLSIWFGDMSRAYTIVQRQDIRLLRDPFTNKPNVRLYTTMRVGGDAADFHALKAIKFAS